MEKKFPSRDVIKALEKANMPNEIIEFMRNNATYLEKRWKVRCKYVIPVNYKTVEDILRNNPRARALFDDNDTIGKHQLTILVMSIRGCSEYSARNAINNAIAEKKIKQTHEGTKIRISL